MRKVIYLWMLFLIILTAAACTVHIPYDWGTDYYDYRVILMVEPDDADVMLDGKFIGTAYEFSDENSAIRLRSRNHELVIKKRGYIEEAINLYDFSTSEIKIRVKLTRDRSSYGASKKPPKGEREIKKVDEAKPAEYVAKTEPVRKPPKTVDEEETVTKVDAVNVTLEISPTESSIYLDGRFWGISPPSGKIENLRLKPGKYTLELVKPGYKSLKKVLEIKDKDIKISLKLQK